MVPATDLERVKPPIRGIIDVDSFELQIYQKLKRYRKTIGLPCVLGIGNRIISISKEAKDLNITRKMKVSEARIIVRQQLRGLKLQVIQKHRENDKPEHRRLRRASYLIREKIIKFFEEYREERDHIGYIELPLIYKNGCDEFILDLTEFIDEVINNGQDLDYEYPPERRIILENKTRTFTGNEITRIRAELPNLPRTRYEQYNNIDFVYAIAAQMISELTEYLMEHAGYQCSAGVGRNGEVAKIACKLNKPAATTAVTPQGFWKITKRISFREASGLGNRLGDEVEAFYGPITLDQLILKKHNAYSEMVSHFGNEKAKKIVDLAHCNSSKDIVNKFMYKTLSCRKNNLCLKDAPDFYKQLGFLIKELRERLKEEDILHFRRPLKLRFQYLHGMPEGRFKTRSFDLNFPVNDEGEIEISNIRIKDVFRAVIQPAIRDNQYFRKNIPFMTSMIFHVPQFQQYREFYVDETCRIYQAVRDSCMGIRNPYADFPSEI